MRGDQEGESVGSGSVGVRLRADACRTGPGLFSATVRRIGGTPPTLYPDAVRRLMARLTRRVARGVVATAAAVARRIACGRAMAAISRRLHLIMRAGRPPATNCARLARPTVFYGSSIDNATAETANPIWICRTRSAIATSSAAAPATARTRSGWPRSRSRTTRRCARATSSPASNGSSGRGPQRRQARRRTEFLARLRQGPRQMAACRWWRGSEG